jgi:NADPH-dependent 2,4-dienoyl-CoA reductase/sulfur reductase-like enzyme
MESNRRDFIKKATALAAVASLPIPSNGNKGHKTGMKDLTEPERKLNLTEQTDVIVCGGGPAGFAAALSAARAGARVRLIELQGYLGGVMTSGLLTHILDYENKKGIMFELINRLKASGTSIRPGTFEAEYMKLLLEELCIKAGVELRYHTRVVAAYTKKEKIEKNHQRCNREKILQITKDLHTH